MKTFTAFDGKEYPVSDQFDPATPLAAQNMNATISELDGRDPREIWPDVPFDLLKFTQWSGGSCGCSIVYMWRRDHPEDVRTHHAHRSVNHCEEHSHIDDVDEHFEAKVAHSRNAD